MDHLHSHCPASLRARTLISSLSFDRSAVSSLLAATPEDLRFEGVGHSPDAALCFLLYSSAVWRTAKHYSDSPSPPSTVKAAWGIARRFLSSQSYLRKGNSRIKAKLKKGKKQIEEVNSLLKEKAPCLVVATDGSSLGNPGPAGGGFLIKELGFGRNAVVAQKSIALGVGTNYFAELSALDAALEEVTLNPPGVSRPIIFLVDNENTLKVAKGTTFSSRYPALGGSIYRKASSLAVTRSVSFVWVPGHMGHPLNELADSLAKRGAAGISSDTPIPPNDSGDQSAVSSGNLFPLGPSYTPSHPSPSRPGPLGDSRPGSLSPVLIVKDSSGAMVSSGLSEVELLPPGLLSRCGGELGIKPLEVSTGLEAVTPPFIPSPPCPCSPPSCSAPSPSAPLPSPISSHSLAASSPSCTSPPSGVPVAAALPSPPSPRFSLARDHSALPPPPLQSAPSPPSSPPRSPTPPLRRSSRRRSTKRTLTDVDFTMLSPPRPPKAQPPLPPSLVSRQLSGSAVPAKEHRVGTGLLGWLQVTGPRLRQGYPSEAASNALPSKPPARLPSPSSPGSCSLRRRLVSGPSSSSSSSQALAPGSPPSPGGRTWHPLFTPTPSGSARRSPFSTLLDWVTRSYPAPDPNKRPHSPPSPHSPHSPHSSHSPHSPHSPHNLHGPRSPLSSRSPHRAHSPHSPHGPHSAHGPHSPHSTHRSHRPHRDGHVVHAGMSSIPSSPCPGPSLAGKSVPDSSRPGCSTASVQGSRSAPCSSSTSHCSYRVSDSYVGSDIGGSSDSSLALGSCPSHSPSPRVASNSGLTAVSCSFPGSSLGPGAMPSPSPASTANSDTSSGPVSIPGSELDSYVTSVVGSGPGVRSAPSLSSSHGLDLHHDSSVCSGRSCSRSNSRGPCLRPCPSSSSSSRPAPDELADVSLGSSPRNSPSSGFRSGPNCRPSHSSSVGLVPRPEPYPSTSSSSARFDELPQGGWVVSRGNSSRKAPAQPPTLCPGSSIIVVPSPSSCSSSKPGSSEAAFAGLVFRSRRSPSAGSVCVPDFNSNHSSSCAHCFRPRPNHTSGSVPNHSSDADTKEVPDTTEGSTSAPGPSGTGSNVGRGPGPRGEAFDYMGSVLDAKSTRSIHPFFADRHLNRKRRARDLAPPVLTPKAKKKRSGVYKPTRSPRSLAARKRKRGHSVRLGYSIDSYLHRTKRPRYSGTYPSLPVDREDATRADNNQFSES